MSRAKDQLWLFHTVRLEELGETCMRRRLLQYMLDPTRRTTDEGSQVFESKFERAVYQRLSARGYHVRTQVCVGDRDSHRYRIDLVVEGMRGRLAVECDGDRWHGPDRYDQDMARQRDLERAGWQFVRIRGGDFYRDSELAMEPVWEELELLGIKPGGIDESETEPPPPVHLHNFEEDDEYENDLELPQESNSAHDSTGDATLSPDLSTASAIESEAFPTIYSTRQGAQHNYSESHAAAAIREGCDADLQSPALGLDQPTPYDASKPAGSPLSSLDAQVEVPNGPEELHAVSPESACCVPYSTYKGETGPDPRSASPAEVAEGLRRIIAVEGPMLARRAYYGYLHGCGLSKLGKEIKKSMNRGLQHAIRAGMVISEDELDTGGLIHTVIRTPGSEPVKWRNRGPRKLEEIPPSEIVLVARHLESKYRLRRGSEAHFRAILDAYELKRLTSQVEATLSAALSRDFEFVSEH